MDQSWSNSWSVKTYEYSAPLVPPIASSATREIVIMDRITSFPVISPELILARTPIPPISLPYHCTSNECRMDRNEPTPSAPAFPEMVDSVG